MKPDFDKYADKLVPVIVQDSQTNKVLMLGYMNEEAYQKTLESGLVCFYSRSRQALWTKGETSGNYLTTKEILIDCDQDCLLVKAIPSGPTCHTGTDTCFNEINVSNNFLDELTRIIDDRYEHPIEGSYVNNLFKKGINKIAQKVGEEAVEVVIEAKDNDKNLLLNEAADLLFHLMILLKAKNTSLHEVSEVLRVRNELNHKKFK